MVQIVSGGVRAHPSQFCVTLVNSSVLLPPLNVTAARAHNAMHPAAAAATASLGKPFFCRPSRRGRRESIVPPCPVDPQEGIRTADGFSQELEQIILN